MTTPAAHRAKAEPMEAVRQRILSDHEVLRRLIGAVERVSGLIQDGEEDLGDSLRVLLVALFRKLKNHMRYEDEFLEPALRSIDAFGPVRADEFLREHEDQREQMAEILQAATDIGARPRDVASRARGIASRLLADMDYEEGTYLHPDVLRDDVIAIDAQSS